jgi:hypothetical protein
MKLTESHIRKIIREELLKEMGDMPPKPEEDLSAMDYAKSAALGAGVAGGAVGINALLWHLQTHPELTKPLIDLLKAMSAAVQE